MNLPKPKSKLISKYVDVIFYGGCNFEVLIIKPLKFTWIKDQLEIFLIYIFKSFPKEFWK